MSHDAPLVSQAFNIAASDLNHLPISRQYHWSLQVKQYCCVIRIDIFGMFSYQICFMIQLSMCNCGSSHLCFVHFYVMLNHFQNINISLHSLICTFHTLIYYISFWAPYSDIHCASNNFRLTKDAFSSLGISFRISLNVEPANLRIKLVLLKLTHSFLLKMMDKCTSVFLNFMHSLYA